MANITVTKECNNGIWSATVGYDLEPFESAMTSADFLVPAQWQTSHEYSVSNNNQKTFWVRRNNVLDKVSILFGFCTGIPEVTTVRQNTIENPETEVFDCVATFTILTLFKDAPSKAFFLPNPIYALNAPCKCDVIAIEFTQLPIYGTLLSNEFANNIFTNNNFEKITYQVNNVQQTGTDVIKYKLHTTCGVSQEGTIELKLNTGL